LQQFWKQVGANHGDRADRSSHRRAARLHASVPADAWRIVDLADPDPQMYANFHTAVRWRSPIFSDPELDRLLEHARTTADTAKRTEDYCAVSRLINKEAIWFWTFQNTYYAISTSKLKGLPKIYHGVIDVSERLAGITVYARLCRAKAPVLGAGPDCRIAADISHRFAAAG